MKNIIYICMLVLNSVIVFGSAVEGYVIDEDNRGVVGATIRIENTQKGTYVKAANGYFKIDKLEDQSFTIIVSSVGKETVRLDTAGRFQPSAVQGRCRAGPASRYPPP